VKQGGRALAVQWKAGAVQDLLELDEADEQLAGAARAAVDDLANCRQTGKALGARETTGDLSGLYRLRFDLPDHKPRRYRVVFEIPDAEHPVPSA
jgi:hypothetical protein